MVSFAFSEPKSSNSYFCGSNNAPFTTTKGFFDLEDCLCICLATNSLPEPAGPETKILLSVFLSLEIRLLTFSIGWLSPIISYE